MGEPYVVVSPAVSKRSLTASRMPSAGCSGRARKMPVRSSTRPIFAELPPPWWLVRPRGRRPGLVDREVDERDRERAEGEQAEEHEEPPAPEEVLALGLGIVHHGSGGHVDGGGDEHEGEIEERRVEEK